MDATRFVTVFRCPTTTRSRRTQLRRRGTLAASLALITAMLLA